MTVKKGLHVLWMAPLSFTLGLPAMAQSPDEGAGLEEIIVTARKREENLLSVPLAITAITSAQLEREGVKDVQGLMDRDPSLSFDTGLVPYDTRIVIRGLSPTRGRPNVATLVDGIDVSSEAVGVAGGSLLINPRLLDVAQVEIVKGPQSALFGRSAFAGAIAYTTQNPTSDFQSSVGLDVNDKNQNEVKFSVSGPISDTVGARMSAYSFRDDGFYNNDVTGQSTGGGEGQGLALTLRWQPIDAYSAKFRSEFTDDQFDPPSQAAIAFNTRNAVPAVASVCNLGTRPTGAPVSIGFIIDKNCPNNATITSLGLDGYAALDRLTGNLGKFDDMSYPAVRGNLGSADGLTPSFNRNNTRSPDNGVTAPDFPGSDREVRRLSLVQELDTSVGRFSLLTGYTEADVDVIFDIDKTSFGPIQQTLETYTNTRQFSQEVRFTSDFEGAVNFFAGLQIWKESTKQTEKNVSVIGEGTLCFATKVPGNPAIPASQLNPAFLPGGLLPVGPPSAGVGVRPPAGSCTNPTGGFTSTDVAPFMSRIYGERDLTLTTRDVDHQSAYLDVEWDVTETLKLVGEARWVKEENDVSSGYTDGSNGPGTIVLCGSSGGCSVGVPGQALVQISTGGNPALPPAGTPLTTATFNPPPITRQIAYPTLKDDYVTPKATLQWTPSDDLNVYASYAQARKPGGYSTVTLSGTGAPLLADDVFFAAERLKVYELGAKWRSPSGNLRLESALFKTDFTDKQVGSQILVGNTISNRVTNAGKALLEGMELALQWRPAENWLVSAGATYFSTYEYTDYKTTTTGGGEIARIGNCVVGYLSGSTFVPLANNVRPNGATGQSVSLTCQVNRTGNQLEDTPELAMAMSVGYRRPLNSSLSLIVDVDANWEDERFVEDDNSAWLDSYWLANLRIGVEGDNWSLIGYINNISDDRTIRSAGSGPAIYASDFRFGVYTYYPVTTPPFQPPGVILSAAPAIPTTVFANLPNPRVIGMRFAYKF